MKTRMPVVVTVFAASLAAGGCAAPGGSPDGFLSSTDNLAAIQAGKTTAKETEKLLGAPVKVTHDGRRNWDYWEYRVSGSKWQRGTLWIGISSDGVVREVVRERERPVVG